VTDGTPPGRFRYLSADAGATALDFFIRELFLHLRRDFEMLKLGVILLIVWAVYVEAVSFGFGESSSLSFDIGERK
jgi:hypothetical protein